MKELAEDWTPESERKQDRSSNGSLLSFGQRVLPKIGCAQEHDYVSEYCPTRKIENQNVIKTYTLLSLAWDSSLYGFKIVSTIWNRDKTAQKNKDFLFKDKLRERKSFFSMDTKSHQNTPGRYAFVKLPIHSLSSSLPIWFRKRIISATMMPGIKKRNSTI